MVKIIIYEYTFEYTFFYHMAYFMPKVMNAFKRADLYAKSSVLYNKITINVFQNKAQIRS